MYKGRNNTESRWRSTLAIVNPLILAFVIIFFIVVGPNNWSTHTYFHGPGTGRLLSTIGDLYWTSEFLVCLAFLATVAFFNVYALYGHLNNVTFAWWFSGMTVCLMLAGLWQAVMIRELVTANKCSEPLNRANDLLWCSACFNTTVSSSPLLLGDYFCRYRPLPIDVLDVGDLSIRADFWWAFVVGNIITLCTWFMFILSLICFYEESKEEPHWLIKMPISLIEGRLGGKRLKPLNKRR